MEGIKLLKLIIKTFFWKIHEFCNLPKNKAIVWIVDVIHSAQNIIHHPKQITNTMKTVNSSTFFPNEETML
jgi:hypothetical protein